MYYIKINFKNMIYLIIYPADGPLKTSVEESRNGNTLVAMGIPYAAPPVGDLRFKVFLLPFTIHRLVSKY